MGNPSTRIIERAQEYLPTTIRQRLHQLTHRDGSQEDGNELDLWMVGKETRYLLKHQARNLPTRQSRSCKNFKPQKS